MISIPVRGGLGTQILSLYAGYALAEETGKTIGEVVFNSGGYPPEALANGDIDRVYFDDLLEFADRPNIISKPGTQKTSAFHEPNLSLLFKHWEKLQEKVWLKLQFVKSARELIHIRQGDRTLVPIDMFDQLVEQKPYAKIISDRTWVYERYNAPQSFDVIKDWRAIISSRNIYAGFSTYVLLSGMLNPTQDVYFFSRKSSVGPSSFSDWSAIEKYVERFPNFHWI